MIKRILLAAVVGAIATAASAAPTTTTATMGGGKILADANGIALYTFNKDNKGTAATACTGPCSATWPAFVAADTDKADGDWTIIKGLDTSGLQIKQWAFKGMPVYYYVKDIKPGDATGDGVGGLWHVVKM